MLPRPRRLAGSLFAGPLVLAGALGVLFSPGAARAQLSILSNVQTTNGTLFNYSYSVTNASLTGQDFPVITFAAPSTPGGLMSLMAPAGFQISFDPGVPGGGLVSFLEDSQVFSTTPAVFSFSSTFAPTVLPFQAVGLDSMGNGLTASGTVLAPQPVPEASTLVSLGAGVLLLTFCAVRRRRAVRASIRS